MHILFTEAARSYIKEKGADGITVRALNRRTCCTVDYTSWVQLGPPADPSGYERQDTDGLFVYVSAFITGYEKNRTLTVKLVDLKIKKMLVLDKNE